MNQQKSSTRTVFFRRRLGMGARVDQLEAEESKTSTWRKKNCDEKPLDVEI
jgi:hypothetical protein